MPTTRQSLLLCESCRIVQRLGILAVVLFVGTNVAGADGDSELWDQFEEAMSETPRLVEGLCVRVRSETVRELSDATVEADNPVRSREIAQETGADLSRSVFRAESASCGNSVLSTGVREDGTEFVLAQNDDYTFHLSKAPGVDAYSILWLEPTGGADPEMEKEIRRQRLSAIAPMTAAWSFQGRQMAEVIEEEGFQIHRIEEILSDGRSLIHVEFELAGGAGRLPIPEAYIVCDPSKAWAFVESGWTSHKEGKPFYRKKGAREVGETVNGVPIVSTMTETGNSVDKPEDVDTAAMTIEILDTDVAEEVFRLSYYGLPEPNFEQSRYGSWLVYLMGGAACLAVAYWLRRRRRAVA